MALGIFLEILDHLNLCLAHSSSIIFISLSLNFLFLTVKIQRIREKNLAYNKFNWYAERQTNKQTKKKKFLNK